MITGLGSIIPLNNLKLFLWQELEYRVCGNPGIDLVLLKKHTRYRGGFQESNIIVRHFWEVLESFTAEHQTLFLRFVWGRSRLPAEFEFNVNFILQPFDVALPPTLSQVPTSLPLLVLHQEVVWKF